MLALLLKRAAEREKERECVCVCVCVCARDREGERDCMYRYLQRDIKRC